MFFPSYLFLALNVQKRDFYSKINFYIILFLISYNDTSTNAPLRVFCRRIQSNDEGLIKHIFETVLSEGRAFLVTFQFQFLHQGLGLWRRDWLLLYFLQICDNNIVNNNNTIMRLRSIRGEVRVTSGHGTATQWLLSHADHCQKMCLDNDTGWRALISGIIGG